MRLLLAMYEVQRMLLFSAPTFDAEYNPYGSKLSNCHGTDTVLPRPQYHGQLACESPLRLLEFVSGHGADFAVLIGNITSNADFHCPLNAVLDHFAGLEMPLYFAVGLLDVLRKPQSIYSLYFARWNEYGFFGADAPKIRSTFERYGYYSVERGILQLIFLNPFCYSASQIEFLIGKLQEATVGGYVVHIFSADPLSKYALWERIQDVLQIYLDVIHIFVHVAGGSSPFAAPNIITVPLFNSIRRDNAAYNVIDLKNGLVTDITQFHVSRRSGSLILDARLSDLEAFAQGFTTEGLQTFVAELRENREYEAWARQIMTSHELDPLEEYCMGFGLSVEEYMTCLEEADFY